MLFSTLILALGTTLVTSAAVPASPSISSVTHSGNGCPQDTAVDVVDGGRQFRLHGFASRAPGVDTTQNCALHFTVGGAPDGWQVSLKHVTVRAWGYFPVGSGLKYYLTGFWSADAEKTTSVDGSWTNTGSVVNGPLVVEIEVPSSERVWSPCGSGGIFNPNFRVVIDESGYYGTRGSVVTTETLTYEWREC